MARVIIGAWGDKLYDNRHKNFFEIEELPEFTDFDEFDPGNPIKAFFGGKGFFVFEKGLHLLEAVRKYIGATARQSCGKCTPCRAGLPVIHAKLGALGRQGPDDALLEELRQLAGHVQATSLCGLGQTATVALRLILEHFRDELVRDARENGACAPNSEGNGGQPFFSYVTAPCIEACPAKVNVPRYIDYIKDGKFSHSLGVILQKYPMAATCGRVCVRFCEMACRRAQVDEPVGIKVLKRFVADQEEAFSTEWFSQELIQSRKPADLRVAIVGAGPAGISAAYHLLLMGYSVDVFEAKDTPGGMAATGIPVYRLPKDVLLREVGIIESLGGRIFYNKRMGKDFSLKTLFEQGYKAVFLALGTHEGRQMRVPGEDPGLEGYFSGVAFLLQVNQACMQESAPLRVGRRVAVVGGGNVAMDCARSALRLGAEEVHLIYRRAREDMPADAKEIEDAMEEGVQFHFLTNPTKILSSGGKVTSLELVRMQQGEPDKDGRSSVAPMADSEHCLAVDAVIAAIGQQVEHSFASPGDSIEFTKWGTIEADQATLMTGRKGVFAGGDCFLGPATLIHAMANGLKAARSIDDYLTYGRVRFFDRSRMRKLLNSFKTVNQEWVDIPVRNEYRVKVREMDPQVRKELFEEVEKPISREEAYREANRCMRCYRVYSVITER